MTNQANSVNTFKDTSWRISYRTSTSENSGQPVNILHDFYIPALKRAVRYDRVAGYFRSSSLAAASQGFSAFISQNGKARFIVGADMDPDDIRAIMESSGSCVNTEALSGILNAELESFESWPENVQNGVHLLAWMIYKGFLDIRVAFRIHGHTGDPISIDSVDDGYVHMKWGVFSDTLGNKLYFTGSLNESRTALVENAENIDVHCDWQGDRDLLRTKEAQSEFETLWEDKNPYLRVLTLPEAVKKRLISIAKRPKHLVEIDGSDANPCQISPPSPLERLQFALIKDAPLLPGGRFVGMETVPIAPWPHQETVARRVIETWPYNYLLCDEVGLGKTIEAGLIIRSLYLSGLATRILITAPASLCKQWQSEMANKFFLPFGIAKGGNKAGHEYIFPFEMQKASNSLFTADLNIVSTGLLSRKERETDLQRSKGFDLTMLDEAHYARRKNSTQGTRVEPKFGEVYKVIEKYLYTKSRCCLFLTATPMQLEDVEVFDLIRLTDRVGPFQYDPSLSQWYYSILNRLVSGGSIDKHEWSFLRMTINFIKESDPFFQKYLEEAVIDGRTRTPLRRWLKDRVVPRQRDINDLRRVVFAASPLSRVMLRHTRPLLEVYKGHGQLDATLPQRTVLPIRKITFTEREKECYDNLEEYCGRLSRQIADSGDTKQKNVIGFYLSFLKLRFASSLFAICETLRRRLDKVNYTLQEMSNDTSPEQGELEDMEDFIEDGDDDREIVQTLLINRSLDDLEWEQHYLQSMQDNLSSDYKIASKMKELLKVLNERRLHNSNRIRQTVIFTRFYDTLADIVEKLRNIDTRMLLGTYSGKGGQYVDHENGKLVCVDREDIKHRFLREEIDVLICTDAAAEGLNLQTADMLVNFDLPWNPMKVEQRIGRIDRIGQKHNEIKVLNLCYLGSAEEIVYGRLLSRLNNAEMIVGTQQFSLLPIRREEFEELATDRLKEEELERRVKERIELIKQHASSREISAEELYNIYIRLAKKKKQSPITLNDIWTVISGSKYLANLGWVKTQNIEERTIIIKNLPGVPDGTALTASRKTYEYGLESINGTLHFASYCDTTFEGMLSHIDEYTLPGCIKRVEVTDAETSYKLVGYAVACFGDDKCSNIQLITSFEELDQLQIDEEYHISDRDLEPLNKQLKEMAAKEFKSIQMVKQVETRNKKAGVSQLVLDYMIMHDLMTSRKSYRMGDDKFWSEIRGIEQDCQERKGIISCPNLRKEKVKSLYGVPFEPQIPEAGDKANLGVPIPLLLIAVDAACRIASKMHIRKSDVLTDDIIAKLTCEIDRIMGHFI